MYVFLFFVCFGVFCFVLCVCVAASVGGRAFVYC